MSTHVLSDEEDPKRKTSRVSLFTVPPLNSTKLSACGGKGTTTISQTPLSSASSSFMSFPSNQVCKKTLQISHDSSLSLLPSPPKGDAGAATANTTTDLSSQVAAVGLKKEGKASLSRTAPRGSISAGKAVSSMPKTMSGKILEQRGNNPSNATTKLAGVFPREDSKDLSLAKKSPSQIPPVLSIGLASVRNSEKRSVALSTEGGEDQDLHSQLELRRKENEHFLSPSSRSPQKMHRKNKRVVMVDPVAAGQKKKIHPPIHRTRALHPHPSISNSSSVSSTSSGSRSNSAASITAATTTTTTASSTTIISSSPSTPTTRESEDRKSVFSSSTTTTPAISRSTSIAARASVGRHPSIEERSEERSTVKHAASTTTPTVSSRRSRGRSDSTAPEHESNAVVDKGFLGEEKESQAILKEISALEQGIMEEEMNEGEEEGEASKIKRLEEEEEEEEGEVSDFDEDLLVLEEGEEVGEEEKVSDSTGHSPISARLRLRIEYDQLVQRRQLRRREHPSKRQLRSLAEVRRKRQRALSHRQPSISSSSSSCRWSTIETETSLLSLDIEEQNSSFTSLHGWETKGEEEFNEALEKAMGQCRIEGERLSSEMGVVSPLLLPSYPTTATLAPYASTSWNVSLKGTGKYSSSNGGDRGGLQEANHTLQTIPPVASLEGGKVKPEKKKEESRIPSLCWASSTTATAATSSSTSTPIKGKERPKLLGTEKKGEAKAQLKTTVSSSPSAVCGVLDPVGEPAAGNAETARPSTSAPSYGGSSFPPPPSLSSSSPSSESRSPAPAPTPAPPSSISTSSTSTTSKTRPHLFSTSFPTPPPLSSSSSSCASPSPSVLAGVGNKKRSSLTPLVGASIPSPSSSSPLVTGAMSAASTTTAAGGRGGGGGSAAAAGAASGVGRGGGGARKPSWVISTSTCTPLGRKPTAVTPTVGAGGGVGATPTTTTAPTPSRSLMPRPTSAFSGGPGPKRTPDAASRDSTSYPSPLLAFLHSLFENGPPQVGLFPAGLPASPSKEGRLIPELLSPEERRRTVTIVFDLDETLVNNRQRNGPIFRPHATNILKTLREGHPPPLYKEQQKPSKEMSGVGGGLKGLIRPLGLRYGVTGAAGGGGRVLPPPSSPSPSSFSVAGPRAAVNGLKTSLTSCSTTAKSEPCGVARPVGEENAKEGEEKHVTRDKEEEENNHHNHNHGDNSTVAAESIKKDDDENAKERGKQETSRNGREGEGLGDVRVEIILWTASVEVVGKPVVKILDPLGNIFNQVIYRDFRWYHSMENYTKNLRRLGRDMDRVVIIENSLASVRLNRKNAILVSDYIRGCSDKELHYVGEILKEWIDVVRLALSISGNATKAKEESEGKEKKEDKDDHNINNGDVVISGDDVVARGEEEKESSRDIREKTPRHHDPSPIHADHQNLHVTDNEEEKEEDGSRRVGEGMIQRTTTPIASATALSALEDKEWNANVSPPPQPSRSPASLDAPASTTPPTSPTTIETLGATDVPTGVASTQDEENNSPSPQEYAEEERNVDTPPRSPRLRSHTDTASSPPPSSGGRHPEHLSPGTPGLLSRETTISSILSLSCELLSAASTPTSFPQQEGEKEKEREEYAAIHVEHEEEDEGSGPLPREPNSSAPPVYDLPPSTTTPLHCVSGGPPEPTPSPAAVPWATDGAPPLPPHDDIRLFLAQHVYIDPQTNSLIFRGNKYRKSGSHRMDSFGTEKVGASGGLGGEGEEQEREEENGKSPLPSVWKRLYTLEEKARKLSHLKNSEKDGKPPSSPDMPSSSSLASSKKGDNRPPRNKGGRKGRGRAGGEKGVGGGGRAKGQGRRGRGNTGTGMSSSTLRTDSTEFFSSSDSSNDEIDWGARLLKGKALLIDVQKGK